MQILVFSPEILVWKTFLLSPKNKLLVLSSKKFPRNVLQVIAVPLQFNRNEAVQTITLFGGPARTSIQLL